MHVAACSIIDQIVKVLAKTLLVNKYEKKEFCFNEAKKIASILLSMKQNFIQTNAIK